MPSGHVHDRITLWTLPAVAGLSLVRTESPGLTLAVVSGFLFGGLMLGPDLDTRSIHTRRWGWLRWIWFPYRYYVRHRSPWSHGPLLGVTVRVCYLLVWLMVFGSVGIALVNELLPLGWTWNQVGDRVHTMAVQHWPVWLAVIIGLELGAISHILTDWSTSAYKRVRKHYPKEGLMALRWMWQTSKRKPTRKKRSRKAPRPTRKKP